MTPAVIDASVAVKWFVVDAQLRSEALGVRDDYAYLAPTLILTELSNALWKYVRIESLSLAAAQDDVSLIIDEFALVDDRLLIRDAQQISSERNHPVYDCLYAALAIRLGAPLITADGRLARRLAGIAGLTLMELSAFSTTMSKP